MLPLVATLVLAGTAFADTIHSSVSDLTVQVMAATMAMPDLDASRDGWVCGAVPTAEEEALMQRLLEDGTWDEYRLRDIRGNRETTYVKTTMHIIRYSNGTGGMNPDYAQIQIDQLNENVASIGLEFCILGDILFHDDDDLAVVTYGVPSTYPTIGFVPDTMNVYVVPELIGAGGFASFPPGTMFVMDDTYMNPGDEVFGHEAGHFFGLWHTFRATGEG